MRNFIFSLVICAVFCAGALVAEEIEVPVLDGPWIKIANDEPKLLGEYANPGKASVCDFTIWQDAGKMWRMAACVRGANWPKIGERLFYHWESPQLTDPDWKELGVFMVPNEELFQYSAIQAPHCFPFEGKFYMFYNGGSALGAQVPFDPANPKKARTKMMAAFCKVSDNGKDFTDLKNTEGDVRLFSLGRDVMVFHDKDSQRFIAYFQDKNLPSEPKSVNGAMYCRTAPRPEGPWSERTNIGNAGNPESPFVVKRGEWYYLWEQMKVFASKDPLVFKDPPIARMTPGWGDGYYAPEIIEHEGQFYIAGYARGIFLAKFKWEKRTMEDVQKWRDTEWKKIEEELQAQRKKFDKQQAAKKNKGAEQP